MLTGFVTSQPTWQPTFPLVGCEYIEPVCHRVPSIKNFLVLPWNCNRYTKKVNFLCGHNPRQGYRFTAVLQLYQNIIIICDPFWVIFLQYFFFDTTKCTVMYSPPVIVQLGAVNQCNQTVSMNAVCCKFFVHGRRVEFFNV